MLATWRHQRKVGSLAGLSAKRGPKANPLVAENAKLRRQNEKLRKDLEAARLVIDVQKKVSRLLQQDSDEAS
jgi:regulator of replication initiation timing